MKKLSAVFIVSALILFGAACGKKTETTTNTNTSSSQGNSSQNTNLTRNLNSSTPANTNTVTSNTNTANTNTVVTNTSTTPATVTVTISSSGVNPKTLTVSAGTKVTFVNNDTTSHQMASDPHPSHGDLPGFDGTVSPGGTYSFTFTKVGSWGYHDHDDAFNGSLKGTIIVQ